MWVLPCGDASFLLQKYVAVTERMFYYNPIENKLFALELRKRGSFMRHKDPELMNRIKQYISEYYLENAGAMPTITEIAHAMEIVRSTAYTYLVSMDRQELIRYQDGKISVRELDKILVGSEQVDAVGEINCGEPALEEANLLYRTSLPTAIFGKGPFIF